MADMTESYIANGVEYGRRPKPWPKSGPSEESEQLLVVAALRRAGVYFVHVPNGGARGRHAGAAMRRLGCAPGFPDLLIFDPPPISPWIVGKKRRLDVGVAVELKRAVAGSKPSDDQIEQLEKLAARGWLATVQWGADAALEYLRRAGYAV